MDNLDVSTFSPMQWMSNKICASIFQILLYRNVFLFHTDAAVHCGNALDCRSAARATDAANVNDSLIHTKIHLIMSQYSLTVQNRDLKYHSSIHFVIHSSKVDICGTVVARWTTGQMVERSILH